MKLVYTLSEPSRRVPIAPRFIEATYERAVGRFARSNFDHWLLVCRYTESSVDTNPSNDTLLMVSTCGGCSGGETR